jgi:DNA invertase Pin-like site-specific DNA recombinase
LTDTKQNSGKEKELSKEVQVLAIFADNPKLSDTEIAKKAGISRTSLYRMKKFKQVKEVLQSSKADLPKGSKSKDGDIEAWNE